MQLRQAADVFGIHSKTKLTSLNDGNGIRLQEGVDDLFFTFADETPDLSLDLAEATTLGDVVDAINNDDDLSSKVSAAISADGKRLKLTDLTAGAGEFTVVSGETGSAAEDLGLTTTAVAGVITGESLTSGLRDTLVASFKGGQGLGTLGNIDITDRNGGTDTVDLASAETLDDLVDLINDSAASVTATVNKARSGIVLTDTSGGSGNLVIADNVDGTESATALGLVVDAAQDSIDSGSLGRQTLSEATLLSSLNGGEGIKPNDIRITDSNGKQTSIDLNATDNEAQSIGDVIDAINASNVGVEARINDTGDGILLTDTALGEETLVVEDISGTLAKDLNLTRSSETIDIDGTEHPSHRRYQPFQHRPDRPRNNKHVDQLGVAQ